MVMLGYELFPQQTKVLSVTPITQLLVTLRGFFATGSFQIVDLFGVTQATISRVMQSVSRFLSSKYKEIIQFPL